MYKSWLQFISKVDLKLYFAEDEVMLCCDKLDEIFLQWNMTTCFFTNHYFSKTSSVVQKCRLRRLISENTRKTQIWRCLPPERWRIYPARVCCTWKHWLATVWSHSNSSSIWTTLTRSNRAKSIEQATLQQV